MQVSNISPSVIKTPASATQTQVARAYMTPESNAVLSDAVLNARIGAGTVAGGLNDTIRFRVDGTGANRRFVPDSKLAVDLLNSKAGAHVIKQLETASKSADWIPQKTNLKGFVLAKDTQAVAAAYVLSSLEPGKPPLASNPEKNPETPEEIKSMMKEVYKGSRDGSKSAGAWNLRGWITFMPDTSRMMLTAAGAYLPKKDDPADARLRKAGRMADYVSSTPTHEVQHSVTPRKGRYENVRWLEEGIANIFSQTPTFLRKEQQATGINVHSYAGKMAHAPKLDLGWGPWQRGKMNPKDESSTRKEQQKRYVDSQPILRGLLRMAGAPLNSNQGIDKARQLLQGTELNRVPGNLANAIIERNNIDREANYEPARQRIISAIEDPKSLKKIAKDFGVIYS